MSKLDYIFVTKELGTDEGQPSPEHLQLINNYAREKLEPEDIFVFPVHAMNDQIDREWDKFSTKSIHALAKNKSQSGPLGKSFMVSHNRRDLAQGRIYESDVEVEKSRKGEVNHLKLWVYIPREGSEDFISNLQTGIYWAVSVGVVIGEQFCSICKEEWGDMFFQCSNGHEKSKLYDGEICYRHIPEVKELYELSSVYLGAQYGAEVVKSLESSGLQTLKIIENTIGGRLLEEKVVVPYKKFPKAPDGTPWSFSASDGNAILGDPPNWNKYKSVHTWVDPDKAETRAGYKLPHHKVVGGSIKTVWRGVSAAGAALMGARGGVAIPAGDVQACKNHLAKHYKEFDKEPPWEAGKQLEEMAWDKLASICVSIMEPEKGLDDENVEHYELDAYKKMVEDRCEVLQVKPPWSYSKICALFQEGAELKVDDGVIHIEKGKKGWTFNGIKLLRMEVKEVKEKIESLERELEEKVEELSAFEVKIEEKDTVISELETKVEDMVSELEGLKTSLESKTKLVEQVVVDKKQSIIKWYKLSKGEEKEDVVSTDTLEKLMDRCGDDLELLNQLEADFRESAESKYPGKVRRSTHEIDEIGEKGETEEEVVEGQVAGTLHS